MTLFERVLRRTAGDGARECSDPVCGNLNALPPSLQAEISRSMAILSTTGYPVYHSNELRGRRRFCRLVVRSLSRCRRLTPADQINEALFERHLYTAGICDPDLLIRTSGEMRVNFSSGKWLMRKFT